jgi:Zn-dependent M28 family amino/carboxypeptidase
MKNTLKKITCFLLFLCFSACSPPATPAFDGDSAALFVENQMAFGQRSPGTEGHAATIEWITTTLTNYEWEVEHQQVVIHNKPITNIIAKRNANSSQPMVILGAHFDTRFFADQDPISENRSLPVPGANDGASGVAILLELARVLPKNLKTYVSLVFFDAEDQGNIGDWDWILGSRAFVNQLTLEPEAVIIVDMVGDADLTIFYEKNSNAELQKEIWHLAASLGYGEVFIPEYKYSIMDDHTPFLEKGIKAIDIIDFDYPYWHTINDTFDKISAESLHAVGDTLYHWLIMSENSRK